MELSPKEREIFTKVFRSSDSLMTTVEDIAANNDMPIEVVKVAVTGLAKKGLVDIIPATIEVLNEENGEQILKPIQILELTAGGLAYDFDSEVPAD